jgi:hypothetical protein
MKIIQNLDKRCSPDCDRVHLIYRHTCALPAFLTKVKVAYRTSALPDRHIGQAP